MRVPEIAVIHRTHQAGSNPATAVPPTSGFVLRDGLYCATASSRSASRSARRLVW
jgi:hypothetical protein